MTLEKNLHVIKLQSLVIQMSDLASKSMLTPTKIYVVYNKKQQTIQNLMTGKEAYERFKKALDEEVEDDLWRDETLRAAKRAFGVDNGNND